MSIHFFHTSDWHLGQLFHHYSRDYEHEQFLQWLIQQIKQKQPHALLIAGDIFDVINPSSKAQKQFYQFLADAHDVAPHMQTLIIAGNHDSGYRIEQVEPLLAKYNAQSIGVLHKNSDGEIDLQRLILPIYDNAQNIIAWCVALPFLRPAEITGFNENTENSQSAIAYLHQQIITQAKLKQQAGQALILMSHAHIQGSITSDSERPIVIGNEEALSIDLFADGIDYVALGHLHKPQKVAARHIRYSGSPIPLSFSEVNYPHQVLDINIDFNQQNDVLKINKLLIPRAVELIPIRGELTEILQKVRDLPQGEIVNVDQRHFVDIEYYSTSIPPLDLRQQIEAALPVHRYRLVRLARKINVSHQQVATDSKIDLEPPTPEQLFQQIWEKTGFDVDINVQQDFLTLLHEAEQQQHLTKR